MRRASLPKARSAYEKNGSWRRRKLSTIAGDDLGSVAKGSRCRAIRITAPSNGISVPRNRLSASRNRISGPLQSRLGVTGTLLTVAGTTLTVAGTLLTVAGTVLTVAGTTLTVARNDANGRRNDAHSRRNDAHSRRDERSESPKPCSDALQRPLSVEVVGDEEFEQQEAKARAQGDAGGCACAAWRERDLRTAEEETGPIIFERRRMPESHRASGS